MNGSRMKAFVSLLVLFLCGGVSGYEVSRKVGSVTPPVPPVPVEVVAPPQVEPTPHASHKDPLKMRFEEDLEALQLSPQEAEAMQRHFEELENHIRDIKADTRREIARQIQLYHRAVVKDLTPAQRKQYHKLQEERRQKKKASQASAASE